MAAIFEIQIIVFKHKLHFIQFWSRVHTRVMYRILSIKSKYVLIHSPNVLSKRWWHSYVIYVEKLMVLVLKMLLLFTIQYSIECLFSEHTHWSTEFHIFRPNQLHKKCFKNINYLWYSSEVDVIKRGTILLVLEQFQHKFVGCIPRIRDCILFCRW